MIRAIFFDFNGVIIDDETIQMKAYQEVLRGHEIALTEELYFGALGRDDKTFVRSMFEHAKKPLSDPLLEEVLGAKTGLHRQMIEELPLFPGLGIDSVTATIWVSFVIPVMACEIVMQWPNTAPLQRGKRMAAAANGS